MSIFVHSRGVGVKCGPHSFLARGAICIWFTCYVDFEHNRDKFDTIWELKMRQEQKESWDIMGQFHNGLNCFLQEHCVFTIRTRAVSLVEFKVPTPKLVRSSHQNRQNDEYFWYFVKCEWLVINSHQILTFKVSVQLLTTNHSNNFK